MADPDRPPLSLALATRSSRHEIAPLLAIIGDRLGEVDGEVVVASSSGEAPPENLDPALVRWLPVDSRDLSLLRLRAVLACRGAVVAVGEDQAVPADGWARAVIRSHRENPEPVVVGCLVNATRSTMVGRANFLSFAGPYLPPMPLLPGGRPPPSSTLSFKREALVGLDPADRGGLEPDLVNRLFGERAMVTDDRIAVLHFQDEGLAWSLRNAYASARTGYGAVGPGLDRDQRRAASRWVVANLPRRTLREAGAARTRLGAAWPELGLVALLAGASTVGALAGTLAGPGRAPGTVA